MYRRAFLLVASCVLCGFAPATHLEGLPQSTAPRIGPTAVWRPAPEQLAAIRNRCGAGDPAKLGDCFLSEMRAVGASPEAIAFAKSLADKGYGYLREFRDTGRVDIAYVEYLFRANEIEGVYLVNGLPPLLDADDQTLFPLDELAKNDSYSSLLQQHPKVAIFPGDRFHTDLPLAKSLGGGGVEFVVNYVLRDGCHACAMIGELQLAFEFDSDGKFTGVQTVKVTPQIHTTAGNTFNISLFTSDGEEWLLLESSGEPVVKFQKREVTGSICFGAPCTVFEKWIFLAQEKGETQIELIKFHSFLGPAAVIKQRSYKVIVN